MAGENITVIKIGDVLMVVMPSDPDDTTIRSLQDEVLSAMQRHVSKGLILDLSAVDTLDSFFARTVSETVQMVRLMGGQTVIAGMRPSVAITATQLGLTLGEAVAALDVDRALEMMRDGPTRRPQDAQ